MKSIFVLTCLLGFASVFAAGCSQQPYSQCGGLNWTGPTCCPSGNTCKKINEWYSQCIPGSSGNSGNTNNNNNNNNSNDNKKTTTKANNKTKTTVVKTSKVKTTKSKKTSSKKSNNKTTTTVSSKPTNSNNNNNNNNNYNNNSGSGASASNLVGYDTMNGGTTGGQGGKVISVSNQSDLIAALKNTGATIIKVNGIIKLSADVNVNSNTSVIGANSNSGITGAGFVIKNSKNVIIQNLKFNYCLGNNKDCITAQKSTNIWVDHCEFHSDRSHGKDYYDGLVDFTHACDYITVSWNYIHDHYKASLVGHSDTNASEDKGKLHITYHHNYFKNIGSRLPSLRFGTGHIFNNVYENIATSSANIRMGAQALIEGNVFKSANRPISTNLDSKQEGMVVERNNDFGNTANTNSITKTGGLTSVPYKYSMDGVNSVYSSVTRGAGPK